MQSSAHMQWTEVMCCRMAPLSPAGLSSESWSIMKNMATELGIVLIGYFTLVPAIQVRPPGLQLGPRGAHY